MKRRLAALLVVLQLLLASAAAAEWDPNDPLLWEPDLPEFDGSMPRTGETEDAFSVIVSFTGDMLLASLHGQRSAGNFLDYAAKREREAQETADLEREKKVQRTVLDIKKKFGKNAILKGMNLEEGATTMERNHQIGGHNA